MLATCSSAHSDFSPWDRIRVKDREGGEKTTDTERWKPGVMQQERLFCLKSFQVVALMVGSNGFLFCTFVFINKQKTVKLLYYC